MHPAIEPDQGTAGDPLPPLPEYVVRAHDQHLREVLTALSESTMVVLVGGSSTGKTRALWEAVRLLPTDWRIWQPIGTEPPETLLRALAGQQIAPRTVLWLDDLQNFLVPSNGDAGRKVAAALRELLGDRERGPVLILGTLWPEDWATVTIDPGRGQPSGRRHACAQPAGGQI